MPFLNTILLVSSGVTVTRAHHFIEKGFWGLTLKFLFLTVILGLIFTFFQGIEYFAARFTFACSSFSSVYFIGTGFHGLHVIIGTVLLIICYFRFFNLYIRKNHSIGFECSVWYWHFVDVV